MRTPPPGSDPATIAQFVDRLVRESDQDKRRQAWAIEADRGLELYLGNHWTTPCPANKLRLVLNRIQNCVIAVCAIQAGDPPRMTFTGRESGDKPLVYLNTEIPEGQKLAQNFIAAGAQNDDGTPWTPDKPLNDQWATWLQQQVEQAEMVNAQAQAMGLPQQPTSFIPDVIVDVTDQTSAQALQTIFDGQWEMAAGQFVFVENITNKNIFGWQPTLVEFKDDTKEHVLTNVHPKLVFPDPMHTDSKSASYEVYDQPISVEDAKEKYPSLAKLIDESNPRQGTIQWIGSSQSSEIGTYDQAFERDMVVIRTCWIANMPYPMTPDAAVSAGKLSTGEVDTGPKEFLSANNSGIACAGCGQMWQPGALSPDDSCPGCGAPLGAAPTRTGYFHPQTNQEITPTVAGPDGQPVPHPQWPTRVGIRKIIIIGNANALIDDREYEGDEIPLPANRNIAVPFSPYAQGEPKRLEGLQMAINRLLSALVTHQAYTTYPVELMNEAVADRLSESMKKARTEPDKRLIIPKDLLKDLGGDIKNAIQYLDVPEMATDVWKLLDLLLQLIDKEGNQSDVMQGDASANWSGETVKALQTAAAGVIRGKSMFTEFYLKRIATIMAGNITNRMEPADWKKYLGAKPVEAIEALHTRAKSIGVDITIEIKSGSGSTKQQQTQNMFAAKQAGMPVSTPTLMESMDLDPDAELAREAEYQRKAQLLNGAIPAQNPASNNTVSASGTVSGAGETNPEATQVTAA